MDTIADAASISHSISKHLIAKGLLQSSVSLQPYCHGIDNADKKLILISRGKASIAVMVSPPLFPGVIAEECLKAQEMRSHLGDLGWPILEPLETGRIQALSFAALPYRKPLSHRRGMGWVDRTRVKRQLLKWLLQVTERLSAPCEVSRYKDSLKALIGLVSPESATATLVRAAEVHLRSGRFAPRALPMHGDLWSGNVLHGGGSGAFTVVDWRGSVIQGFPLFDLIRVADSFRLSGRSLRRELELHRAALGCRTEDLPLFLLGALGHYAARLGEMPPALFRTMADECVRRLTSALAVAVPSRSTPVERFHVA